MSAAEYRESLRRLRPVVYVDGWAVLGSVDAKPKRGKLVADILDRVQRAVDRKVDKSLRKHLDR